MQSSPISKLAVLAMVILTVLGCRGESPAATPVRLGVILSLSGAAAPYGQDNLDGIQLAADKINAAGGIQGRPLEILIEDSAGEPAQAIALARKFASDKTVVAIVGPTRTGSTVAVAKLLPSLAIPMMSVGSTGDWGSAVGEFNEWTFRSTRVDTYLVEPLLQTARDTFNIRRIAIIYTADDDWSVSILNLYKETAQRLGLETVAIESQMTGDTDRSAQLTKIAAALPDGLVVNTLSSDAPTIAAQARDIGIEARFLGTAGFTNPDTWELAGAGVLDGTILAENYYANSDRAVVQDFVSDYEERFGRPAPPYAAYSYDGLMLIAEACKRGTGVPSRSDIRSNLANTKNFDAVLGVLSYTGSGDADKEAVILQIDGKDYSLVEQ